MILCAPTEPKHLIAMVTRAVNGEPVAVSSLPESYGADFLWSNDDGFFGLQRKTWQDLMASAGDGRLSREAFQWGELKRVVLLVEGTRPATDTAGSILDYKDAGRRWTIGGLRNLLRSCELAGAWLEYAQDLDDTAQIVGELVGWSRKPDHKSLSTRPGNTETDGLGRPVVSVENWLLQGLPGIGRDRAEAIIAHFGGVPLAWTVTEKELREVPGIGPKLARMMAQMLDRSSRAR